ncbi:MAG: hypothetical protein QW426_09005 [Thermofilum sp.]
MLGKDYSVQADTVTDCFWRKMLSEEVFLEKVVDEVYWKLRPLPPPLKFRVDDSVGTAAVDLHNGYVTVSSASLKSPYAREFIAHEFKHASADGLPYTLLNAKRHEGLVIKDLSIDARMAQKVLNMVYDIVVDYKLHLAKFNVKGFQEHIVSFSPVTREDDWWGKLNGLYRSLVGANVGGVNPPPSIVKAVKKLARDDRPYDDGERIVALASYFGFSKESLPENVPLSDRIDFTVPPEIITEVMEIAVDLDMDAVEMEMFLGDVGDPNVVLAEVARKKIWNNILTFSEIMSAGTTSPFNVLCRERAKPYSVKLDPVSVYMYPDDPRKWKEKRGRRVFDVPHAGGMGGFSEVIALLDVSGSTAGIVRGKSILSYEKDVVAGLAALATVKRYKFTVIPFHSTFTILSGRPVNVMAQVLALTPGGDTLLGKPAEVLKLKKNSLIAIVTDGEVFQSDVEVYSGIAKKNRVVIVVVNENYEVVKKVDVEGVKVYYVRPSEAERIVLAEAASALGQ